MLRPLRPRFGKIRHIYLKIAYEPLIVDTVQINLAEGYPRIAYKPKVGPRLSRYIYIDYSDTNIERNVTVVEVKTQRTLGRIAPVRMDIGERDIALLQAGLKRSYPRHHRLNVSVYAGILKGPDLVILRNVILSSP